MRSTRTVQPSVFQAPEVVHPVAEELERASTWLDEHPELLDTVSGSVGGSVACGRRGLTCETILRCAVLKHLMGYSYRALEFALHDSATMQRFARVDPHEVPKKSALHAGVKAIDAEVWRSIDGVLVQDAKLRGVESGTQVRIDSTVTDTNILKPSDSRLLYDGVRVLTRLLRQARGHLAGLSFCDHCRAAKRREQEIRSGRGARRHRQLPAGGPALQRRVMAETEVIRHGPAGVRRPSPV